VRRVIGVLVAVFLTAGAALELAPVHAASWTSSSYASRLVQLVNQARQQHGLGSLTVASGTSQVAASWTAHLDAAQSLSHNPDLRRQLETHGSGDWTTYGENVGQGPAEDPDALFQAYMNSAEHRSNILSSGYRFTGVAVVLDGKTAWNTFDFVDSYHSTTAASSTPTPTKPKPKPTPRPAVTAPAPAPVTATHAETPLTVTAPRTTAPAHSLRPHTNKVRAAARSLPRARARQVANPLPDLADLLAGSSAPGTGARTAVLAASVRPLSPVSPASSELMVALAGLLVGFVGVRWWNVARAA